MMPNNFTAKSQEAIQRAQMIAHENGQPGIEPIHLFAALLTQEDGVVITALKKMEIPLTAVVHETERILRSLPQTPSTELNMPGHVMLAPAMANILQTAT
jgi:ATP-dependent Clp protease ATP-binding subunit ClpB